MRLIPFLGYFLLSILLAACATSKGDKLMKAGQWEEAVRAYQEELKDDIFDPDLEAKLAIARARAAAVYAERGEALLKDRNLPGAIEAMNHALSLDPTNANYRAVLAGAPLEQAATARLIRVTKTLRVLADLTVVDSFHCLFLSAR